MRIVTAQELESWLASGKVLEEDARGPKVVRLSDGRILKIFHSRRALLLVRLRPPAQHFARNASLLQQHGIAAPHIDEILWLDRPNGLSACIYRPLPGTSLEQLFKDEPRRIDELLPALACFIFTLHSRHIYFRSLHLGNILLIEKNKFGLIDFLDLHRKTLPLSKWHVKRNFRHLENYLLRSKIKNFPLQQLEKIYWTKK